MAVDISTFNASIGSLGYRPVNERDLITLHAAFGDLLGEWVRACLQSPASRGQAFHALRSALFAVSPACSRCLLTAEVDAPPIKLCRWLVEKGEAGRALVRRAGADGAGRDLLAARQQLRSALVSRDQKGAEDILLRTAKVHGSRFAFTFERTWSSEGLAALQVEGAERDRETGRYQWSQKLAVQLNEVEIVGLIDVLSGRRDAIEFVGHGAEHNKTLLVRRQDRGWYVNLRQGAVSIGAPITGYETFKVMALCCAAVAMNNPGMTHEQVLALTAAVGSQIPAV